ncbi:MAG: metallo-mystery pair system four-Cys motif protein [Hydrogenophaga sp.]|nr:metallo-mystery pair system four-Cys motif protein [Hydrogenophaga sp.]
MFAAEVNGQPFACGQSYPGVGTTKSTVTPSDLRVYVSELALLRADGQAVPVSLIQDGAWQLENIALLDFEDGTASCRNGTPALNTTVRGTVPPGDYQGVRFTLGVPFGRNHGDPTVAPAPLNNTAMFWNWQGGYKFLKFDSASSGRPVTVAPPAPAGGGSASGFSVHLGSTVCASAGRTTAPTAPCQNPNRVSVEFKGFDATRNSLVLDIGRVLGGANVDVNAPNTSPGCMSFPKDADCPPVMGALGLAYDGVPAPGAQQLFSVR